ncbi:type II toxin-antitoxin system Phd/YefM family antitoxin [Tessaracoccus sp. MC1679]|uniref:type II toxin-antitoxin system Phd/YefM family antitoxin n=1 Tax=Tessaracoccus sp. MC1679 TaxID=2760313 RepID=UPI0015FFD01F|nr:type II toxin-antitoxin system Phd/YefM family antitoxin [Tessaracoccus sp. MC1679]MBB1517306.1 type II toxin-antitoxin system Phd/YefM family antitoxin [Tessaracoccus sp. MC1679]
MTASVGIREFRAGLAEYIAAAEPVAVTRHGQTVGWFIPTPATREAEVASLRTAAEMLDALLAEHGVDADAVVEEFKTARRAPE